jgi:hypothetical protein
MSMYKDDNKFIRLIPTKPRYSLDKSLNKKGGKHLKRKLNFI